MKKTLSTLIVLTFMAGSLFGQCPSSLELYSQSDVNAFAANYPNCTEIEGTVLINGANITDLSPLYNLTSVGNLYICYTSLPDLTGLESLTNINGYFHLTYNYYIKNTTALANLQTIGGYLYIEGNDSLITTGSFGNLVSVGQYFFIINNAQLENIDGFNNLISVGDYFAINHSRSLIYINGFEKLHNIGSSFDIYFNPNLEHINGFGNLTTIGGGFYIAEDSVLESLCTFSNLTSIPGPFMVYSNPKLLTLQGLEELQSIAGDVDLGSNLSLTSFTGLENLRTIGGHLNIYKCNQVKDLAPLNNLISMDGSLNINWNNSLESIAGLGGLPEGCLKSVSITFNPALSKCEIQSVCSYLANPTGDIELLCNADGCNNSAEVLEACSSPVNELAQETRLSFYPNPASGSFSITGLTDSGRVTLNLYTSTGQRVLSTIFTGQPVNIAMLSPGIYFAEVTTPDGTLREKLVIK